MKRPARDQQKKLQNDAKLMRAWRKWHREALAEVRAGEHGELVDMVMTCSPGST